MRKETTVNPIKTRRLRKKLMTFDAFETWSIIVAGTVMAFERRTHKAKNPSNTKVICPPKISFSFFSIQPNRISPMPRKSNI